jgi:pimeloyl-ACP methyl ester carboxylesterase
VARTETRGTFFAEGEIIMAKEPITSGVPCPEAASWPPLGKGLTRKCVMVAGHRMSYVTGGSGPPVLLLHGLGANSFSWRHTMPALLPHYTVFAPDMLGCGESDKAGVDYGLEAMASYVAGFMDAVGLERAHVVGHSMGGGLAMQFHHLYPGRTERLALVSSGGMGRAMHWLLRISTLPGAEGVISMLADPRLRFPQMSRNMEVRRMRRLEQEFDATTPTMLDRFRSRETRQAFLMMLRGSCGLNGQRLTAVPLLAELTMPVLLIWGGRDATIPVAHGQIARALIPNAHLEVLAQCFHRPQLEAPQRFNELLLAFLQAPAWPPSVEVPDIFTSSTADELPIVLPVRWHRRVTPATLRRFAPLAPVALAALGFPTSAVILRRRRRRRMAS